VPARACFLLPGRNLASGARLLRIRLSDIESVSIVGVEREYLDGLREVAAQRPDGMRLLVMFLGSTIGNFDAGADARFCARCAACWHLAIRCCSDRSLEAGRANAGSLRRSAGVSRRAFNRNLLGRMNRELDSDFDLRQFEHVARFNQAGLQYRNASAVEDAQW